jgi:branched-chain amino acid transport system permease protein
LLSIVYPISPLDSSNFLFRAFVVCILGGLGSVPGAIAGGITLGLIESFGGLFFGTEHVTTLAFVLLLLLLFFRPTGLLGLRGYE